ncbi:hypothetical protein IW261DRAFT_1054226 [Armillaria novae-zelandiae]|uniref:F-box domain-containing protein n=1 Tax=Armillaria novae-zelandiae TaxID=153914 RepID=A0AA39U7E7_9AGAR|nr:hypothetical protein IW261DRAFT_1054226 [Armillaria novae-zelandiae]
MLLSALPFELLYKIASLLGQREQHNLCLISKKFCCVATPLVFEMVSISLTESLSYRKSLALLKALKTRTDLAQHVQDLNIHGSFDPPYENETLWHAITNGRGRDIRLNGKCLLEAIPSLVSLRSLHFYRFYPGELSPSSVDSIMHALSKLPLFSDLTIDCHELQPSPVQDSYSEFHDLEHISFGGLHMLDVIPPLVARSPNVTRLAVFLELNPEAPAPASSIFSGLPKGKYSRVQKLVINGAAILPAQDVSSIVPHLHHLTSLCICINGVAPEFWSALRIETICLQVLSVNIVNDGFLEYLASYSGVKSMTLIPKQPVNPGDVDISSRFWDEILPRHADTLSTLVVCPGFERSGGWCLHTRSLDAIRKCTHLETLSVQLDRETFKGEDKTNIIVGLNLHLRIRLLKLPF